MNLYYLAAVAATEAPVNEFGFVKAMEEGGPVAWSILTVMVIMSVGSFYILFTKYFEQAKVLRQYKSVTSSFWRAATLKEGAAKLEKNGAWRQIADDAINAQEKHGKMNDNLEAHDYMHGSLQRSEDSINYALSGGLSFLASVGATAPFIGLLGTVTGMLRTFNGMVDQIGNRFDSVVTGISEALITTQTGLVISIPALVLLSLIIQRRNTLVHCIARLERYNVRLALRSDCPVPPEII